MSQWKWPVDVGSSLSEVMNVSEIQFGDGYAQNIESGINHEERSFRIRSSLLNKEFLEAREFLRAHRGTIPIDFVEPKTGSMFKALVKKWDVTYDKQWVVLAFEAERVYIYP